VRAWTAALSRRTAARTAQKGAKAQAIGRSRGGLTTKMHLLTEVIGRPVVIRLTADNRSDVTAAKAVLAQAPRPVRRLMADRGYDADWLRRHLRDQNTVPIIPGRNNRKRTVRYDKRRYQDRWSIEASFGRLKDFRRVATRYDKLASNDASVVALATIVAYWL
jgi:transposase